MIPFLLYFPKQKKLKRLAVLVILLGYILQVMGCSSDNASSSVSSESVLPGEPWIPQVPGLSASNHNAQISVAKETQTLLNVPLIGLSQPLPNSKLVTVNFNVPADLGRLGSITLMGQAVDIPQNVGGGAFAYLVSLSDSNGNDFIHLNSSCYNSGLFSCSFGNCSLNSQCIPQWPSAYYSHTAWDVKQGLTTSGIDQVSVNTFPTCNWTEGLGSFNYEKPGCAFNSNFFPSPSSDRLASGLYTAKYALLSDSWTSLSGVRATLKFSLLKKTNNSNDLSGAIDLNIILTGTQNVKDSRTKAGKRNLNSLISGVAKLLQGSDQLLRLGEVHAIEWYGTEADQYADLSTDKIENLFKKTSSLVPQQHEGNTINAFLVNSITDKSAGSFTILGQSGAIGGPALSGTSSSGLVFSTFQLLATMNKDCSGENTICPESATDADFVDLVATMTHELAHYLGLFHVSESTGTMHDAVFDTPICTNTDSQSYITINSCRSTDNTFVFPVTGSKCYQECLNYNPNSGIFCSQAQSCIFNNLMWVYSKNYDLKTHQGDANFISAQQEKIINYSPFVQ